MRHSSATKSPTFTLERLRAIIEDYAEQPLSRRATPVSTGWESLDAALGDNAGESGGLARGTLHEWFGQTDDEQDRRAPLPPLAILAHLTHRAIIEDRPGVIWIGRRCWPYPPLLARRPAGEGSLLEHSVFVDARDHGERVWALDVALRSPAVAAVIGDAGGLSMAESRRLQLAAAAGGTLGLIVRPLRELGEISAARTRWLVRSEPSHTGAPGWRVELLRCKGMRPLSEDARQIAVRWSHETGDVGVVPDALDRPLEETRPMRIRRAV